MATPPAIPRVDVLGVQISAGDIPRAADEVARWIEQGEANFATFTGVHGVMESQRDPELLAIHNRAGLTNPDGMPMVWASRMAGVGDVRRVYGPDFMLALCERSVTPGWRHFFYGGKPGVADELAASLVDRFPGLQVAGTWSPPFGPLDAETDAAEVARIEGSGADIVWVGLSTPKQERWAAAHVGRVGAPALLCVGAAFDMHAGHLRQAPAVLQRLGLEWAFRLATEPRRLWRRYLSNNPRFVLSILRRRPFRVRPAPVP